MAKNSTLSTASVLAFERKIDPSDAVMAAGKWAERQKADAWSPIAVHTKSVRGTISNRLKTKDQDPAKLDAAVESPNLQTVDVATLPPQADTLQTRFTLRILAGAGTPSACNNAEYQTKLQNVVKTYVDTQGFKEQAKRYAINLANARFLWRNRVGAEEIVVVVRQMVGGEAKATWEFNALSFSLRHFDVPAAAASAIDALTAVIAEALAGKQNYALLDVVAFARMGDGQEVYPSQELILDKGDKKGGKSKTLYQVGEVAAMHSQKIGNALRTIDTWYPNAEDEVGPIAVEPYGSVTPLGRAFRTPRDKQDFYTLLDEWLLKDKEPSLTNQHFVFAVLIRGGVFGDSEK